MYDIPSLNARSMYTMISLANSDMNLKQLKLYSPDLNVFQEFSDADVHQQNDMWYIPSEQQTSYLRTECWDKWREISFWKIRDHIRPHSIYEQRLVNTTSKTLPAMQFANANGEQSLSVYVFIHWISWDLTINEQHLLTALDWTMNVNSYQWLLTLYWLRAPYGYIFRFGKLWITFDRKVISTCNFQEKFLELIKAF